MFLAVNAGNTHVTVGVFDGEDLWHMWRIASNPARTEDELRLIFVQMFAEKELALSQVRGCMICSVIPRLIRPLSLAVEDLLGVEPLVLTHELDLGIRNDYQPPSAVGADRLANAVGGVERYGCPLVIVDAGTAITFDVISSERSYLGGVILPGLDMSADALFAKTSLLPRVAIDPTESVIGRSTQESITSGLIWGSVAAIDFIVHRIRKELKAPDCPVVATGGHSSTLAPNSRELDRVDIDLTLFGMLKIWERNTNGEKG
jgi:type III pantothenate kinase